MRLNLLEKSVLATVAYYDVLDYPLTGVEVFKYLINPLRLISQLGAGDELELGPIKRNEFLDILKILKNKNLKKFIEEKNGFYFLKGRRDLFEQRIERQKIAIQRWKKVYKVIKYLQICPFIKMIAVCNSLAIDNSKQEADIDFFIIVKRNRIWLTRFLITLIVWLLGEWRHKKRVAAKICLSFYITDAALNLENISILPYDIYLAHWIAQLKPVYCRDDIYKKFILANKWLKTYLSNLDQILNIRYPEFKINKFSLSIQELLEKILKGGFGNIIEKFFGAIQRFKIKRKLVEHKIPTAVVVSDEVLKFHENDRREFFQEEFKKRLKLLTNNNN
jgi:hypothetical protein